MSISACSCSHRATLHLWEVAGASRAPFEQVRRSSRSTVCTKRPSANQGSYLWQQRVNKRKPSGQQRRCHMGPPANGLVWEHGSARGHPAAAAAARSASCPQHRQVCHLEPKWRTVSRNTNQTKIQLEAPVPQHVFVNAAFLM